MERVTLVIYTLGIALILHNSVWIGSWHGMVVSATTSENSTNQSDNGTLSDGNGTVSDSNAATSNDTTNSTSGITDNGTNPSNGTNDGTSVGDTTQNDVTTTPATTTETLTTEAATTEKSGGDDYSKTNEVKTVVKSTGVKKEVIIGLSAGFGFGLLLCIFLIVIWNCCCNKLCSDSAAKIMPVDFRNTDTAGH